MARRPRDSPAPKLRTPRAMEWHEAVAALRPHVVRISTPEGTGTGWLLSRGSATRTCAIATAAHVLQQAHDWDQPIKISDAASKQSVMLRAPDRAIFIDSERDTACVVFSPGQFPLPSAPLTLSAKDRYTKVGVEIGWLGFPAIPGAGLSFFSGRISSWQHPTGTYFVDGVAISGVSGGPAFRIDGQTPVLMGVVSSYIPNRAAGGALPGVAVVRNVSQLHDVTASLRSLDDARRQQESAPAAPVPAMNGAAASAFGSQPPPVDPADQATVMRPVR